jgi:D-alanyl-D-alanine carboxypeptidase
MILNLRQTTICMIAIASITIPSKAVSAATLSQVPDELADQLQTTLDQNRQTPGATVGLITPEGSWFGASGVANLSTEEPVQANDLFQIGSITKSFTATTILKLTEENVLSLDDTLEQWLPEIASHLPDGDTITVRQLLNGTSGLPSYIEPLADAFGENLSHLPVFQPEELVSLVYGKPRFSGAHCYPEAGWCYPDTGYILAGLIVEKATGSSIATEIRNRILTPLGLNNTFFAGLEEIPQDRLVKGYADLQQNGTLDDITNINLSYAWANGALISNVEDLARYTQGLFSDEFLQPASRWELMTFVDTPVGSRFGLGIVSANLPGLGTVFATNGATIGYQATVGYSPDLGIVFASAQNIDPDLQSNDLLTPLATTLFGYQTSDSESVPEPGSLGGVLLLGSAGLLLKRKRFL